MPWRYSFADWPSDARDFVCVGSPEAHLDKVTGARRRQNIARFATFRRRGRKVHRRGGATRSRRSNGRARRYRLNVRQYVVADAVADGGLPAIEIVENEAVDLKQIRARRWGRPRRLRTNRAGRTRHVRRWHRLRHLRARLWRGGNRRAWRRC